MALDRTAALTALAAWMTIAACSDTPIAPPAGNQAEVVRAPRELHGFKQGRRVFAGDTRTMRSRARVIHLRGPDRVPYDVLLLGDTVVHDGWFEVVSLRHVWVLGRLERRAARGGTPFKCVKSSPKMVRPAGSPLVALASSSASDELCDEYAGQLEELESAINTLERQDAINSLKWQANDCTSQYPDLSYTCQLLAWDSNENGAAIMRLEDEYNLTQDFAYAQFCFPEGDT